jgi:hypothetical protein
MFVGAPASEREPLRQTEGVERLDRFIDPECRRHASLALAPRLEGAWAVLAMAACISSPHSSHSGVTAGKYVSNSPISGPLYSNQACLTPDAL